MGVGEGREDVSPGCGRPWDQRGMGRPVPCPCGWGRPVCPVGWPVCPSVGFVPAKEGGVEERKPQLCPPPSLFPLLPGCRPEPPPPPTFAVGPGWPAGLLGPAGHMGFEPCFHSGKTWYIPLRKNLARPWVWPAGLGRGPVPTERPLRCPGSYTPKRAPKALASLT